MTIRAGRRAAALLSASLLLGACAPASPTPSDTAASVQPSTSPVPSAGLGQVVPAPGSDSAVYQPNPAAIVVAIDAGHGGCLDWGAPDPLERGPSSSEKAMTLAISLELQRMLEAQGITVVMTRTSDVALAGDDYPDLDCHGPAWRDVNGDGEAGFDPEGKTRTRDELQARLDLVNLARADLLVSIHINAITQNGVIFEIATTQTYWTDETAWGPTATQRLAQLIQDGVVAALDPVATYERQDRGISAVNLFIVAPPLFETTPERPDPVKQPTRGALLPTILTEVGSITLAADQDLLLSSGGQAAAAQGIADALAAYFSDRPLAVRYDALVPGGSAGEAPDAVAGDGPPYWAPVLDAAALPDGTTIRVTNTGTSAWPTGLRLMVGWEPSDDPYLRRAPVSLDPVAIDVPTLQPGESIVISVPLSPPTESARQLAWITLADGSRSLADLGSPPLQLALDGA